MAVCEDCEREMLDARSCIVDALSLRRRRYARHRAGSTLGRSGDGGVTGGGYHHLGCDLERCPRCRGQLPSCGCAWLDDDTESLIAVVGDTVVCPAGGCVVSAWLRKQAAGAMTSPRPRHAFCM
jgi:hypothetical protein